MARKPSAKRYAMALFQLGLDNGTAESLDKNLRALEETMQEKEFVAFLGMPKVRLHQKIRLVTECVPGLDPMIQNLVGLLIGRGMVGTIPAIREEYGKLLDDQHGRGRGHVASAVPLKMDQRERLASYLGQFTGKNIELTTSVDQSIVAGLIVRVGDMIIDGSSRTRLRSLKKYLFQSSL